MIFYYFYCKNLDLVMTNLGAFTAICFAVFLSVMLDLVLGIKESRKQGHFTHSYGLRRTIEKLTSYLALVIIGFVIDAINPIFFYWGVHHLPLASVILAFALIYTEGISIKEHLSDGTRKKMRNMPRELRAIMREIKEVKDEVSNLKN